MSGAGEDKEIQLYKPKSGQNIVTKIFQDGTYKLNFDHENCSFDIKEQDLVLTFTDDAKITLKNFASFAAQGTIYIELENGAYIQGQDLINAMIQMDDFSPSLDTVATAFDGWFKEEPAPLFKENFLELPTDQLFYADSRVELFPASSVEETLHQISYEDTGAKEPTEFLSFFFMLHPFG